MFLTLLTDCIYNLGILLNGRYNYLVQSYVNLLDQGQLSKVFLSPKSYSTHKCYTINRIYSIAFAENESQA